MIYPRCPSPFKAFFETSVGYVRRLTGKARRALSTLAVAIAFLACVGCGLMADAPPQRLDLEDSVVVLKNVGMWQGSGVVVGKVPHGTECKVSVVTAGHVAKGAEDLQLDSTRAFSIAVHPTQDIAFAVFMMPSACDALMYKAALIGFDQPQALDTVIHVGYPHGQYMIGYATFVGLIAPDGLNVAAITAIAGPGSSGGAVFYHGRLIGILVMGERGPPFRNYYTPMYFVTEIVPDLA